MSIEEMKKYVLKALENNFTLFPVEIDKDTKLRFKDGDSIWECGIMMWHKKKPYSYQFGDYAENMAELLDDEKDIVGQIAYSILTELSL